MRISDWSSDVCSSDLKHAACAFDAHDGANPRDWNAEAVGGFGDVGGIGIGRGRSFDRRALRKRGDRRRGCREDPGKEKESDCSAGARLSNGGLLAVLSVRSRDRKSKRLKSSQ